MKTEWSTYKDNLDVNTTFEPDYNIPEEDMEHITVSYPENFIDKQEKFDRNFDNLLNSAKHDYVPPTFDYENQKNMNFNAEEGTLTCTLDSTDPMDAGRRLYRKKSVDFLSGTTIMVGPNGVGKTTLINCIEDIIRDNNIKVFDYDNLHSGGKASLDSALFYNDLSSFATIISSSEGENILFNIRSSLGKIKRYIDSQMEKKNEPAVLLFDAIDSGLSLDFMFEIKRLFNAIVDSEPEEYQKRIFIICTSNSYELARGFRCWDVKGSKEIYFNKYQEYADFIIDKRRAIDKSIEKQAEQSNNDTIDD